MKKYLSLICAAMLCACCLTLAACGGGSSSGSAAASGSAAGDSAAASASASVDPTAKFLGDWKLAAMEYQGMTVVGDLSAIAGEDVSMSMTVAEDGKGTIAMGEDAHEFTWKAKDDDTITMTITSDSGETTDTDVAYANETLTATFSDESMDGTVIFSHDGKIEGAKEITMDNATPITSKDALVGTWKFSGLNFMGLSMYGDADELATVIGDTDLSLTFTDQGTVTMGDSEMTYTVDANGATMGDDSYSTSIMALGDDIVLDMSEILGMDMIMLLSK